MLRLSNIASCHTNKSNFGFPVIDGLGDGIVFASMIFLRTGFQCLCTLKHHIALPYIMLHVLKTDWIVTTSGWIFMCSMAMIYVRFLFAKVTWRLVN